jgi:White spot syndrome virus structural envelope protein VP
MILAASIVSVLAILMVLVVLVRFRKEVGSGLSSSYNESNRKPVCSSIARLYYRYNRR